MYMYTRVCIPASDSSCPKSNLASAHAYVLPPKTHVRSAIWQLAGNVTFKRFYAPTVPNNQRSTNSSRAGHAHCMPCCAPQAHRLRWAIKWQNVCGYGHQTLDAYYAYKSQRQIRSHTRALTHTRSHTRKHTFTQCSMYDITFTTMVNLQQSLVGFFPLKERERETRGLFRVGFSGFTPSPSEPVNVKII